MIKTKCNRLRDKLIGLCDPILEDKGFELVQLEVIPGKRRTILRFFLDRLSEVSGITVDECARMNRELGDILEFEAEFDQPYVLEVSSPGLDRPLVKETHFQRFAGNKAHIHTFGSAGRTALTVGILRGVENHLIILEDEKGEELRVPFSAIKKARIKYEWNR
ncbi:MAG: hypothetical protein B6244_02180 [Candidatus Cloacimonetes bacterium 4572_55]|nr:MAG: hypothetical protein B6244_02180 [Candidatus Cloacimonetes bacterium 4572_55]